MTDICIVCKRPLVRKGRFCHRSKCLNVKSSFHKNRKEMDEDTALMLALETHSVEIAASGEQ
jgi:hypothetical protein